MNPVSLTSPADEPVTALLNDFVGARGEIEFLVFVVVGGDDVSRAKDEGGVAVSAGLRAGNIFEPRSDRLEGVEFDEGVLFQIAADEGREFIRFLVDERVEVVFDRLRGRVAGCAGGEDEGCKDEKENQNRFSHEGLR